MPTKKTKAPSFSRANTSVNAGVRAEDERLREQLLNADLRKFDKALRKGVHDAALAQSGSAKVAARPVRSA